MAISDIEAFWQRAITKARINVFEVVTGPDKDSALTPPAWSLDDESVKQALATKTLTLTSPAAEHELMPKVGGLSILLWEDGEPAALLKTEDVTIHKTAELDELNPGDWQAVRGRVPEDENVIVERFSVIADNA